MKKLKDIVLVINYMYSYVHTRVETGSGHPGHGLSTLSRFEPVYKLSGSDLDSAVGRVY